MQDDAKDGAGTHPDGDRRSEPRLPEELLAVMTDNAVASELIGRLPEEERLSRGRWVAEGESRAARARRAVDVVRDVIDPDVPPKPKTHR
ncbi:MAG: hypothetical protein QOK05_2385 [Chloroflexota bacterium]|jgi:hypothetical protein|nr:hypothetical protein [Chloroflexota bacterium]